MVGRSQGPRWNLLEAAAWIAGRNNDAVDRAARSGFDQSALSELYKNLLNGKLSATGIMTGPPAADIAAHVWQDYRIFAEPIMFAGASFLDETPDFYVKVLSHGTFSQNDLRGASSPADRGMRHDAIISVSVASDAVRKIWPVARRGTVGRPPIYDWSEIARRLKKRSTDGSRPPADVPDLIILIKDIQQQIDPDKIPDDSTVRAAINTHELDAAAGMARGN